MKRALTVWSVVVLSLCGLLAMAEDRPTTPAVSAVRLGVDGEGVTRVVFDLDAAPRYRLTPQSGSEPTLKISIDGATFALDRRLPEGLGAVGAVTLEEEGALIALADPALPARHFVLPPKGTVDHYRLVVDLAPASPADFAAAATAVPAVPVAEAPPMPVAPAPVAVASVKPEPDPFDGETVPTPSLKPRLAPLLAAPARDGRITVTIDAGHGGRDPGAIGASGIYEKDITLSAAQILKTLLEARGYAVILTRDEDRAIELEDRIEVARRSQADLFLSLHADALDDVRARGATVYTLDAGRSARLAQEVTAQGNFRLFDVEVSDAESDISRILFDIASSDTQSHSARLAAALIAEMEPRMPMVNNTHRTAGYLVLLSPDVPAVLVEMAFLSNPRDEKNLRSEAWRRLAMTAVADGIDRYFDEVGRPADTSSAATVAGGSR